MAQRGLVPPGLVQPGMAQRGLVQPGAVQPGLVQPGVGQRGLMQPGIGQPGLVQPVVGQRGLVQPGAVQPGLVQPGVDQRGLVQPGAVQPGAVQPGLVQPGVDQRGVVQPGEGQPGLVQPGAVQPALVQPGVDQPGLVQPGVDQPGLVQPGTGYPGLVQPVVDQRGVVQPGEGQPGSIQPGAVQPGSVQPGTGQHGLVQPDVGQRGLIQPGEGHPGVVQPVMDQPGLVQPGIDQRDLVQPSVYQRGLVQPDTSQLDFVQPGMDQRGLLQPSTDPRGFVRPGSVQPGMYPHSLVQPGAYPRGLVRPGTYPPGLAQPGAYPRGLVQPGAYPPGLVQPGAYPRGWEQPGAYPRGLVQPGAYPRGLVQPGAYPRGLVQPGAYPRGLVQPGAYPRGWVQPGAYPRGFVRPGAYTHDFTKLGTDQHGLRHPGADQRGLTPSGAELRGFPTFHQDSASFLSPRPYQQGLVPPGRDQRGQVSPLLAMQGLAQEDLVPAETYRQGLLPPGTDQHGPALLGTDVESAGPDQEHLVSPGPQRRDQVHPSAGQRDRLRPLRDFHGLMYPGPRGPGYQGVDQHVQEGLGLKQPGISIQIPTSQDATFARSTDDVAQDSLEKSDFQRERKDSLDRVAPSFPIAVETFRLMGELISLYMELKEKMKELDEEKSGQTEMEKIQYLLALMMQKTIPPDLQEQLKTLKTLTKEIQQEKAKMQKILETEKQLEMGKEMKAGQLGLQLGILRVTVADIEKELAELRESQERGKISMEHSVAEASIYLQDQLDKLRTIIESMLASSSTLLSMSMAPEKTPITLAPGQIDPEATCPACSLDVSHQVSTLVQRYEQLQDMVNNLAASRPSKKSKLQSQQDEELLGHVQSAILQVQGDCEKLNITTMHSKMLMDIEKVQIHFGGSVKASSQMIRELLQAQCLSSPCYKRVPDMADYTYSTVPRRCGGSHTLTYPYRRSRLQHLSQGLCPSEEIQVAMKHDEVDILGLDGHIYKGRMDTRLPGIPNRDNSGVNRHKAKPSRSHVPRQQLLSDSSQLPSRPQSAQLLVGSTSAPSRQRTDRPVSSEGRFSQPNAAHLPSASEMAAGREMPLDMPPGEGLEEPTRGPRSTTAH
uniref:Glutamine rich 2 n=1 Tax=Rousettus aegyptiacus TaxID=9407 RepID=A0A7J8GFL2_ROUAE|nr:glutamine rich 2 [Rousettus aegyptiacus]